MRVSSTVTSSPSSSRLCRARSRCTSSPQTDASSLASTVRRALPGDGEQATPDLTVGAGVRLTAARLAGPRRIAGPAPGTCRGHGTGVASRFPCLADEGAELHDGHAPRRCSVGVLGQQLDRPLSLGGARCPGRLERLPAHRTSQDASDVRVQHRVPLPERERRDGRCGVVADSGQRPQLGEIGGQLACVTRHADLGGGMQAKRAARIAESAPRPDGIAGRGRPRGRPGRASAPARRARPEGRVRPGSAGASPRRREHPTERSPATARAGHVGVRRTSS